MKDFVIEDGQMYYRKKPLYRQPLFWTTIVGLVLTFVLGFTCVVLTLGLNASQSRGTTYPDYLDETLAYKEYQIGDKVNFSDGLDVTVTSMEKDDSVSLVDDYYSSAYVVEVEVENATDERVYFDEYYFNLIDPTTQIPYTLDLSTYDVNLVEKLEPGEKINVKLIYGVDDESSFGLVYEEAMWTDLISEGI
ncbi:DUF4352 domain-containing protein [Streptococcus parasuis]|uniref:DUF4352 domain-containing protein n=1 Tax=Streptococcus parasuis TaxID=1501662 RepID=UPI002410112C|nr:DUF4352 domain-containing protein [Streptococcus parasuis]MDG3213736.1 DUF4352 domain-containing protein [Streptococcus suis]WJQ85192.1 DUF4352 domain-containing protein [Streptococcus parasuis]